MITALPKNSWLVAIFSVFICLTASAQEYTPNDVYAESLIIEQSIKHWKVQQGLPTKWNNVPVEVGYKPRHVFQKAIEILEKINHYRVNIAHVGAIPVSRFVGKEITPNDVFLVVHRVREELVAMLQSLGVAVIDTNPSDEIKGKSPSDVFAKLCEISFEIDELLGLRGITPSDVYDRTLQLVSLAKFIRRSQNLALDITLPVKTEHKLSNHALASVNKLIIKINKIEKNLSLETIKEIEVPRRVIVPSDVYGALGIAFAELLRIQHHLGLEKNFPITKTPGNRTPDDVIFNMNLAISLLPDFSDPQRLQRYDRLLLRKTLNHAYSLTHYILEELEQYSRIKGINLPAQQLPTVSQLAPKHAFTKGLEAFDLIVQMRVNHALARSAVPSYPLQEITAQEVFDIALKIDEFLYILFRDSGLKSQPWISSDKIKYFHDKSATDVYINMWKINSLLKVNLGNQGVNLDHVFSRVDNLNNEVDLILARITTAPSIQSNVTKEQDMGSEAISLPYILASVKRIQKAVAKIRKEGDVDNVQIIFPKTEGKLIEEIYSRIWQLEAGLSELKAAIGIKKMPVKRKVSTGKSLSDLFAELALFEMKISALPEGLLTPINKETR